MSYEQGWAALNLQMPERVPHTEYSAEMHWDLIRAVTGVEIPPDSDAPTIARVQRAFMQAWQYDLVWNTALYNEIFGPWVTRMGNAEYQAGGISFNAQTHCPFTDAEQVLAFDPLAQLVPCDERAARLAFEQNYNDKCAAFPDAVNMTGIYVTCISGLIEIFGWELLLTALGCDAVGLGRLVQRYARFIQPWFNALAASEVPVVMVHDDITWTSGPFVHPQWYREYVFPAYRQYFAPLLESGKKILFTSDGDYTLFIDDIVACGVHGLVLEPATDMAQIAERHGQRVAFVGNADTRVLLSGTRAEIRAEVERCMAIGKRCPGFFMAVGNHIPVNTPVENARYYYEVYQELSRR